MSWEIQKSTIDVAKLQNLQIYWFLFEYFINQAPCVFKNWIFAS